MSRLHRVVVAAVASATALTVTVAGPAVAAPPVAAATVNSTYSVVNGDSLIGISMKLKVTVKDLLTVNNLRLDSLIWPGMTLVVPAARATNVASAAAAPAPAASTALTYTVVKGDFLSGIASRLNVKLKDLLTVNNLNLNSLILPGRQLTVPAGGTLPAAPAAAAAPAPTAPAAPQQYTIAAGDSLSVVATRMGVKLGALLTTNKLSVTSLIVPGMKLTVPDGGSLPVATAAPAPAAAAAVAAARGPVAKVLAFTQAQLGRPYKFNTAGPDSYDCSGLTLAAYATIGISLPHYSGAQMAFGTSIDWKSQAIQPGDLVFLESAPGTGIINHVGIATSATTWIQAPRTGDVVRSGTIPSYRVVGVQRLVNG
jgi:LysM repeat protein